MIAEPFGSDDTQTGGGLPTSKIGNLSGDEYSLSCIRCGSIGDLHQVAFRNVNNQVTGYLFACRGCEPLIFGKSLMEIVR